jgi:hypothetical protein
MDEELSEATGGDAWAAHLPEQELVPAYMVSRFAAQYRVVVEVLEAQDCSVFQQRPARAALSLVDSC